MGTRGSRRNAATGPDAGRGPARGGSEPHDPAADPELARWTTIATRLLHAPIGLITLLDGERRVLKSSCGLADAVAGEPGAWTSACTLVIDEGEPLVLADGRNDPRLPRTTVGQSRVAGCLGVPLHDEAGRVLGSFCVGDTEVRDWSADDLEVMLALGSGIERQIRAGVERRSHERLLDVLDDHHRIHDLIATEAPLEKVLQALVESVQDQTDGMLGSVLLYDPGELRLWHLTAPGLPEAYCAAIDGITAGPRAGSCGTAAFLGQEVFVDDIATDPRWSGFRDLAAAHRLRTCWSVPVLDPSGDVLATFALYDDRPRTPLPAEVILIRNASRMAGIAIQRHRAQEWLDRFSTHDPLTGLPNRVLLEDCVEKMLSRLVQPDARVTALVCDINGLKMINDSLGHEAGDRVLTTIAERLVECVGPEDTVARLGGDEFVIATAGLSATGLSCLADRLIRTLGAPIGDAAGEGAQRTVSVTVGIAGSDPGVRPQDLIRRADAAMHQAKRAGRSWGFYEEGRQALADDEMRLHSALHGALERGELSVVYQPIFDAFTGAVTSVEALMRWTHAELGRVGPDLFVPIAEKHGLIAPMGDWVLRQAAVQGTAWNAGARRPILVAVNVSPRQLLDVAYADRVAAILRETGLAPELLSIEITETALMADDAASAMNLQRLHRLGAKLALDDFGTGYSSLSSAAAADQHRQDRPQLHRRPGHGQRRQRHRQRRHRHGEGPRPADRGRRRGDPGGGRGPARAHLRSPTGLPLRSTAARGGVTELLSLERGARRGDRAGSPGPRVPVPAVPVAR